MPDNNALAMRAVTMLSLGAAFCLFSSCSHTGTRYFPVTDHKERSSTLGFSITPPAGSGWYEKLQANTLYYLKKTPGDEYAIYTTATEISLQAGKADGAALVEEVRHDKELVARAEGYQNVSLRLALEPWHSSLCVRYNQEYENHGVERMAAEDPVRIRKKGLVCMHPKTPRAGIDICYVESFRSADPIATSYGAEGESFIGSLRFFSIDG